MKLLLCLLSRCSLKFCSIICVCTWSEAFKDILMHAGFMCARVPEPSEVTLETIGLSHDGSVSNSQSTCEEKFKSNFFIKFDFGEVCTVCMQ